MAPWIALIDAAPTPGARAAPDALTPLAALAVPVLLARVGQMTYAAGLSRSKNAAGSVLRGVVDLCVTVLAFWAVGAAILFRHGNGAFGIDRGFLFGASLGPGAAEAVLLFAVVSSLATGAVVGAAAERSRFFPLLAASVLLAALVVPVAGNWATHGWLARLGFSDPAGACWAHVSGGVCAAVAAWAVGPRQGKYNRDGSAGMIPGHGIPLAGVGALMMVAGWLPYVAACATRAGDAAGAGRAALNVLLAAAAAGLAAVFVGRIRYGKPDVGLTLLGVLGGLVSVTAAAGAVAPVGAVCIGLVGGILVPLASVWIDLLARIDDPVGAVAVHAVGGLWGTLAAGLFAPGSASDRARHLGVQALGAVAIAAFSAAASLALFVTLRATVGLRPREADEYDGLDLAEHDIAAYPDFQHNTIRSFHMREA